MKLSIFYLIKVDDPLRIDPQNNPFNFTKNTSKQEEDNIIPIKQTKADHYQANRYKSDFNTFFNFKRTVNFCINSSF